MASNKPSQPSGHAELDLSGRLPTNVKPSHYKLTLATDLKTFDFGGEVTIVLDILEESKSITLHSLDLDIQEPVLQCGDKSFRVTDLQYNKKLENVVLKFDETLPVGKDARLSMRYAGVLGDDTMGIYRAKYTDPAGNEQWSVITQMEPLGCRQTFPCFDEPALKATFEVTMVAHEELTCLTNMDVKDTKIDDKRNKTWIFNTSPPMSTYLIAFGIGKFNVIETNSFRIPVRVYATPNNDIQHAQFALQFTAKTMEFFEEKFGLQYPLPKVDTISTLHFLGAMENWGLILYADEYIMVDEDTSDGATFQLAVNVIQHELAHQWFGNIVTMEYWDGLWLNESFATWAALFANDKFYPEWKLWQFNLADEYDKAFYLDSLRSSHPIEVPIKRESDVHQIFDAISYSKGSCVLRMITKYIGEETFLEGVRKYLKKHEYKNTKTDDLWDALTEVSGKDIKKFGDTWTRNVGHPILTVKEDQDSVHVTQNRFLRSGDVKPTEDETLYPIFLALRTSNGVDEDLAFDGRDITFKKPDGFFKINADQVGLYRTLYQPERLDKLVDAKAHLTPEDQFNLVNDASALAAAGYQSTARALWLTKEFGDTSEYIVWKGIIETINTIQAAWIFEPQNVQEALEKWLRRLVSTKANELGWTFDRSDTQLDRRLKALLFDAAVRSGSEKAVKAALEMFAKFKSSDHSAIDQHIAVPVYLAALAHGDEPEEAYNAIVNEHRTAKSSTRRHRAQRALGGATQPHLIQRTLQLLLSDEVDGIEMDMPLYELCCSESGLRASGPWLKDNLQAIKKKYGAEVTGFGSILDPCIGHLPSEEPVREFREYFKDLTEPSWDQLLEQSFDEAQVKIGWVNRDREEVKKFLESEGLL